MYLRLDTKKYFTNSSIHFLFLFFLVTCTLSPIHQWILIRNDDFMCKNGYLYWLVANSSFWGGQLYNALFFILPVLSTGLLYFNESSTSIQKYSIVRNSKKTYILSKIIIVFLGSFFLFLIPLLLNLIITDIVFPFEAPINDQYLGRLPNEGSFARTLFNISPLTQAVGFCTINAFVLSIFSVFTTTLHMICNFKNKFSAIIIPTLVLYTITFISDHFACFSQNNIRIMIQPAAHWAMYSVFSSWNLITTLSIWIIICIALVICSIKKNEDLL